MIQETISEILSTLNHPDRIHILFALGKGEACVCHLEDALGKRQAYISQHLMVLREEGLLTTRREGRYVYYRVTNLDVFKILRQAAKLAGVEDDRIPDITSPDISASCCCPKCTQQKKGVS